MDNNELISRIDRLEAEKIVLVEFVKALISRIPPDNIGDAPFRVAIQSINAKVKSLPEPQAEALTAALKDLNFYGVSRVPPTQK